MELTGKFLTPGKYWEWRTTIEELHHAELKLKHCRLMYSLMEKDIEIQKLKAIVYKEQSVKGFEANYENIKKGYEEFKKKIEEELEVSLNGTVIDDVTYEIKKLES